MISGVSVIFDWGPQDRGLSAETYNQADVVDAYGLRLNEELDCENVRTHYIDTRRPPLRTDDERLMDVPDNYVPLYLSCGWHDREKVVNSSVIEYAGDYFKLADSIRFALAEWGRCYVFGHRVLRPVALAGCKRGFIRIKPFALNGPHAHEYVRRLDKLGEDLGRAIGEYMRENRVGLRS